MVRASRLVAASEPVAFTADICWSNVAQPDTAFPAANVAAAPTPRRPVETVAHVRLLRAATCSTRVASSAVFAPAAVIFAM